MKDTKNMNIELSSLATRRCIVGKTRNNRFTSVSLARQQVRGMVCSGLSLFSSSQSHTCVHLHSSWPRGCLVVPFIRRQAVAGHWRKCIDEMSTQTCVNVFREELDRTRSILRPVRIVTHPLVVVPWPANKTTHDVLALWDVPLKLYIIFSIA